MPRITTARIRKVLSSRSDNALLDLEAEVAKCSPAMRAAHALTLAQESAARGANSVLLCVGVTLHTPFDVEGLQVHGAFELEQELANRLGRSVQVTMAPRMLSDESAGCYSAIDWAAGPEHSTSASSMLVYGEDRLRSAMLLLTVTFPSTRPTSDEWVRQAMAGVAKSPIFASVTLKAGDNFVDAPVRVLGLGWPLEMAYALMYAADVSRMALVVQEAVDRCYGQADALEAVMGPASDPDSGEPTYNVLLRLRASGEALVEQSFEAVQRPEVFARKAKQKLGLAGIAMAQDSITRVEYRRIAKEAFLLTAQAPAYHSSARH